MTAPPRTDTVGGNPRGTEAAAVATVRTASGGSLRHTCAEETTEADAGAPDRERARSRMRLIGIDAARGVALVGMMAVHTIEATDDDGSMSLAWTLAAGKSSALFALLAGVGIALTTGRRRRPHGRAWVAQSAALLVRAVLIAAVGLLLGYAVPPDDAAVILPYYALMFVLAVPLLALPVRALVVLAALIGVGMPFLSHRLRAGTEPAVETNPTFTDLADHPLQLLSDLSLTGVFPALSWMAYVCVGLALGRSNLGSRLTGLTVTLIGAALMAVSAFTSWLLLDVVGGRARLERIALESLTREELDGLLQADASGTTPTDTGWWLATMAPHSGTPLDIAYTIGVAMAALGICLLLSRVTTALFRPLAAIGGMSLTVYAAHLLLLSWPALPGGPLGLVIQTVVLVSFALLWTRFLTRGPLEDLLARATRAVRRGIMARARPSAPLRHAAPMRARRRLPWSA